MGRERKSWEKVTIIKGDEQNGWQRLMDDARKKWGCVPVSTDQRLYSGFNIWYRKNKLGYAVIYDPNVPLFTNRLFKNFIFWLCSYLVRSARVNELYRWAWLGSGKGVADGRLFGVSLMPSSALPRWIATPGTVVLCTPSITPILIFSFEWPRPT